MYHWVVGQVVRRGFRDLSAGNYEAVLKQFSSNVVFSFAGQHALGGEQRGVGAVRAWFQRVYRLFPGLRFEPFDIQVRGWPWNTTVRTRFKLRAVLPKNVTYHNEGEQRLRLRWGRVVEDHLQEDLDKLNAALDHLAQHGNPEAWAAPLL